MIRSDKYSGLTDDSAKPLKIESLPYILSPFNITGNRVQGSGDALANSYLFEFVIILGKPILWTLFG